VSWEGEQVADGTFDLVNWPLVFWEIVVLALAVFLIVFFVLATRYLIRANRDDGVAAHRVLDERYVSGESDRGEYEQKRRDLEGRAT